ncbi:FAD-dependent monooxygenase [Streptomyces sp. SID14478]|uniref:FAD-dependent oxidoreductase n=1 Tax=Streptomyces sp. SID14478 TaxID=2706073 RepID=UPI0013D9D274|nr:NAD(P)/FAD-dependent oxidoreductase [Streptomyces sp. SID14478]NEB75555.1 FAD-dependent monooxygenase [Streptomyces sp. SID14478]
MKVLVIGAGLGGLALAQGLQRDGVDVQVFERRSDRTVGLQGYGLHLNEAGCAALRECLPPAIWAEIDADAGYAGSTAGFYDHRLRPLTRVGNGRQGSRRSISRLGLRDRLLEGMPAQRVRWGKEFTHYEQMPTGQVRAHFADGTHADGDLLVGADASNSRVRRQYLPDIARQDTGVLTIAGRTPLTARATAGLPAEILDGTPNSIVPAGSGWMFVCAWRTGTPPPVEHSAPAADGSYVVWAYIAHHAALPPEVTQWTPAALRDLALSRMRSWAPALTTLVGACDITSVAPVTLRSMPELTAWPSSNVTLLGDAIHNMTPMAGVGANTALRDAAELRRALRDVTSGRRDPVAAVAAYETRMRAYANPAVAASRRNARNAGSSARLPRTAFRTLLRAADRAPPLKRAMFAS